MEKLLLVVEERFQLTMRPGSLALVPEVSWQLRDSIALNKLIPVKLESADRTIKITKAIVDLAHFNPGGYKLMCFLEGMEKEEVPIGTEIWLVKIFK